MTYDSAIDETRLRNGNWIPKLEVDIINVRKDFDYKIHSATAIIKNGNIHDANAGQQGKKIVPELVILFKLKIETGDGVILSL